MSKSDSTEVDNSVGVYLDAMVIVFPVPVSSGLAFYGDICVCMWEKVG